MPESNMLLHLPRAFDFARAWWIPQRSAGGVGVEAANSANTPPCLVAAAVQVFSLWLMLCPLRFAISLLSMPRSTPTFGFPSSIWACWKMPYKT